MKTYKYFILLLSIALYSLNLYSQESLNASVSYKIDKIEKDTINRNIFGGFAEFLNDYINGPMGLWAQELQDRGFDYILDDSSKTSYHWQYWNKDNIEDSTALERKDKYNENGLFSQLLEKKSGIGETGIRQRILISDTITHSFYIYAKSSRIPLNIQLLDTNGNIVFKKIIETTTDWKKYEFQIPKLKLNSALIYFSINENGTILIDESSLMPDNNILGIRSEYAQIFREWKPTVMRFPGGSFISNAGGEWWSGINFLDKRKSSIKYGALPINQRMDMGYIEYFRMCEEFGISTYIVSAYLRHTNQDHMNFLEFLMGDENSEFGSLRAEFGHPKPFKVDFFEFGNEEWDFPVEYAQKFKVLYDIIKAKYPKLRVIAAGNHWNGKEFIESQMEIIKNSIDNYGFHPAKPDLVNDDLNDSINFLSIVGIPDYAADDDIKRVYDYCRIFNTKDDFKVGITEWWSHYGDFSNWTLDINLRNNSLESGLWDTGMLLGFMKNPQLIELTNRTLGMSWINRKISKQTGKKAIFASVGLKSATFLNSHRGNLSLAVDIDSPKYNIHKDSLAYHYQTNYLDASSTFDKDSIYLYFINRSPVEDIVVSTDIISKFGTGIKAKKYVLTSNYYLDHVTAEEPNSIKFTDENVILSEQIVLKPFSFVTYSFANKVLTSVSNDKVEKSKSNSILVYDILKLNYNEKYDEIKIYDINGRLILNIDLQVNQDYVDTRSLKHGFYSVILSNKNSQLPLSIYKM